MVAIYCCLFCLLLQSSCIFSFRPTSQLLLLPLRQRSLFGVPQLTLRPTAARGGTAATAAGAEEIEEAAIAAAAAQTAHLTTAAERAPEVPAAQPPVPTTPPDAATAAADTTAATAAAAAAAPASSYPVDRHLQASLDSSSPLSALLKLYPRSCNSKTGTAPKQPVAAANSEQQQQQQQTPSVAEASGCDAAGVEEGAREVSIQPTAGRWLAVGRVGGAHGLRGHLAIFPSTAFEEQRFCCPSSRLFFGGGGVGGLFVSKRVESGRLIQGHRGKPVALVKLQGVDDRAAATALSGFRVYVHYKQSAALVPPHSVLAADLIGFDVQLSNDPNKEIIGKITDVVSKRDMKLKPEAVDAADDCLEIAVYRDLPARRLLLEAYRDPAAPPSALLASALHALGPDQPQSMQKGDEGPPVVFECEGCGLRFSDCAAAVTHERLCLQAAHPTNRTLDQCENRQAPKANEDEQDSLEWLLRTAAAACDLPTHQQKQQQQQQQQGGSSSKGLGGGGDSNQVSPLTAAHKLLSLEGPQGCAGRRRGRQFYERLSLGSLVSWDRGSRFFPKRGEAAADAAERALNYACSSITSSGTASSYTEADWNDAQDIVRVSAGLGVEPGLSSVACEADKNPKDNLFLLPFVLGVTVDEVKMKTKTVTINAPPGLLH